MKLLYISGTYYPAAGGAEISMHTFLKNAVKKDIDVLVATNLEKYNFNAKYIKKEGVNIFGVDHESRVDTLDKIINNYKPDKIITQLMWSDVALKLAKYNKVNSILRFCKIPAFLDLTKGSEYEPTDIMVVSEYVQNYVHNEWGKESTIIYPLIDIKKNSLNEKKYITMFNPNSKKGGPIFKEIAKLLPGNNFAYVEGWDILKSEKQDDVEQIKRICESLNIEYKGQRIEDTNFDDMLNVKKFSFTSDVSKIYAQTSILLVPSQWQEAFGRVAIEGMINRIPVIGSDVGGLSYIVNNGGILIKDYKNSKEWVNAIKLLESEKNYDLIAKKGELFVKKEYDFNKIFNDFLRIIHK